MFTWDYGRQGGGYRKMSLVPEWLSRFLKADCYLLHIPAGSVIVKHIDPAPEGYDHHRVNITFWKHPDDEMYVLGPVWRFGRIEVIRPDLYAHGLAAVKEDMYILSFGWLKKSAQRNNSK